MPTIAAQRMLVAGLVLLVGASAESVWTEDSSDEATTRSGTGYEMPERLRQQVSPLPSEPWKAPDLSAYTTRLKSVEESPIDPQRRYELAELVDLAQQRNPETRVAWERARQAAIGVGLVESEY